MKYRIIYNDSNKERRTLLYDADSFWHAKSFGEKMFKENFIECEDLNPPTDTPTYSQYSDDFNDGGC